MQYGFILWNKITISKLSSRKVNLLYNAFYLKYVQFWIYPEINLWDVYFTYRELFFFQLDEDNVFWKLDFII